MVVVPGDDAGNRLVAELSSRRHFPVGQRNDHLPRTADDLRVPVRHLLAARLLDGCGKHTFGWHRLRTHIVFTQSASAQRVGVIRRTEPLRFLAAGCVFVSRLFDDHGVSLIALAAPPYCGERRPRVEFSLGAPQVAGLAWPGELQVRLGSAHRGTRHNLLRAAIVPDARTTQ